MLEFHDLHIAATTDTTTRLIEKLSLTVDAGEIVLLHGPSGCGKTTLLRAVAGLIDPLSGHVRLSGIDAGVMGWHRFRRQVMLVQQRPVLLEGTVIDNLVAPFTYRSVSRPYPFDEAVSMLERLNVPGSRLDQPARTLSEGEQQRVCLIRAMLIGPRVLLLDEPTSALDEAVTDRLDVFLREWADAQRSAVVMVRHDVAKARSICDRAVDLQPYLVNQAQEVKR